MPHCPPDSIFVIDDDPDVLESVRCLLASTARSSYGYISAETFLKELCPQQSGCLITDIEMPGMNGWELQQKLTEIKSPLSIIFVTGFGHTGVSSRFVESGNTLTLLEKPYHPARLLEAVQAGIARSLELVQSKQ